MLLIAGLLCFGRFCQERDGGLWDHLSGKLELKTARGNYFFSEKSTQGCGVLVFLWFSGTRKYLLCEKEQEDWARSSLLHYNQKVARILRTNFQWFLSVEKKIAVHRSLCKKLGFGSMSMVEDSSLSFPTYLFWHQNTWLEVDTSYQCLCCCIYVIYVGS